MPAKKTAAKKAVAKKATKMAIKKVAKKAVKKAVKAAKKSVTKKASSKKVPPSYEKIAEAAYLNYRHRMDAGIPGDHDTDWAQAVEKLS